MHMAEQSAILGPVDYLIIRFPGNKFSGKIAPELVDLEKKGIIRIIDLVMILKDEQGKVLTIEAKNLEGEAGAAYRELVKDAKEWFTAADIEAFAESLPNNCSAGLLLFENIWAIRLKQAMLNAEAELVDMGRIPPETIIRAEQLMAKGEY
jgi:hypothetical protein